MKKLFTLITCTTLAIFSNAQTGIVTITAPTTVCSGTNNIVMVTSGYAGGAITRWETSPNNNPPWTALGGTATATITVNGHICVCTLLNALLPVRLYSNFDRYINLVTTISHGSQ